MDTDIYAPLHQYITAEILMDPNYDLKGNEPLISSGLIRSFSLVDIALWIEEQYGVYIDESEMTGADFDTLDELVALVKRRMENSIDE